MEKLIMAVKKIMKMEQKPGVQQKWTLKETMCQDKMNMVIVEKIVQNKGQQNHQIKNSVSFTFLYAGSPPLTLFFETLTKPCKLKTVLLEE